MELNIDKQIIQKPMCYWCEQEKKVGIAMLLYANKMTCGECYIKIARKLKDQQNKQAEQMKAWIQE